MQTLVRAEGRTYYLPRVAMKALDLYLFEVSDPAKLEVVLEFVRAAVDQNARVVEAIETRIRFLSAKKRTNA